MRIVLPANPRSSPAPAILVFRGGAYATSAGTGGEAAECKHSPMSPPGRSCCSRGSTNGGRRTVVVPPESCDHGPRMATDRDTFAGMGAFLAAVEEGSFSRAATKLGLTPSGVSKLVARLEERLDVRLFHRTTRQMQLTDIGSFYLDRVRRIFEDVRALDVEIERTTDAPRGLLRVTAPVVLGHHRVLPAVIAFRKAFPGVRVALLFVDHLVDLIDGRID